MKRKSKERQKRQTFISCFRCKPWVRLVSSIHMLCLARCTLSQSSASLSFLNAVQLLFLLPSRWSWCHTHSFPLCLSRYWHTNQIGAAQFPPSSLLHQTYTELCHTNSGPPACVSSLWKRDCYLFEYIPLSFLPSFSCPSPRSLSPSPLLVIIFPPLQMRFK